MKKLILFLIAVVFFSIGTQSQSRAELYTHPFPFIGRWQPTEDPALLDAYGIQDIQNLRKWDKHFRGVLGDAAINETAISGDSSYYKPRSGYHFKKDNPSESHILIQAYNAAETASKVYENKTVVPNRGEFEAVALHTDTTGAGIGRFSIVPQGNVAYCNQKESLIWGGNERLCHGFLIETLSGTTGIVADHWDSVYNNDSETYVTFSTGATTFYIGSTRRMDRAKIYVKTANTTISTLAVSYYTGWSWVPVMGLTDGTAVGGVPLAQTGTMTWTFTTSARTTFIGDDDTLLYWYKFEIPNLDPTTAIYYITVGEGAFRNIENIWDGALINTAKVWFYHLSAVSDFTDNMNQDPPAQDYAEDIGGLVANTEYLLIGTYEKLRGFEIRFEDNKSNTNVSGVSVQWYNGLIWSGVTGLIDGTLNANRSFNQNGRVHWLPTEEWGVDKAESKTTGFSTEFPLYYYRILFNANLSTTVRPYYIRGIPAQPAKGDFKKIGAYRFPVMFQGRLFLLCEDTDGSRIRYSATDSPDVFNGSDSGSLYIGDSTDIYAAGILYNVFVTAGYEQLVVVKGHSTYRIYGDNPSNWIVEQMSDNIGISAPLSFVIGESTALEESGARRNVAIWQATHGYVQCDGSTITTISIDTQCYWDTTDARGVARHRIDDTVTWYDPDLHSIKIILSSGAELDDIWGAADRWESDEKWGVNWEDSVTVHNAELEYSLQYKEWTKLYREDTAGNPRPLQIGFQAKDIDNKVYTYGAADNGIMYRLEYTNTWDRQPVHQYLRTADIMPGTGQETQPFFNHSSIEYIRLLYKNKAFESGETVVVTHWGDGIQSVTGTSGYKVPADINMSVRTFNTQDCFLGPNLRHSFQFDAITSTQDYGMELLGLGLWYSPVDTILGVGE